MHPVIAQLQDINAEAVILDGFEDAILGLATRAGMDPVMAYNRHTCVAILMDRDGMDRQDAEDYMDYNVAFAFMGDGAPVLVE